MPHIFSLLGILSLTYIAFNAAQISSTDIPPKIVINVLASMLLTMAGLVMNTNLVDIKYTGHKNYDTIVNRPSLYVFNHRGRLIFPRTGQI